MQSKKVYTVREKTANETCVLFSNRYNAKSLEMKNSLVSANEAKRQRIDFCFAFPRKWDTLGDGLR